MTQRSVPFPLTGYQLPTSSFNRGYQSPTGSFNQGYQSPHQVLSPDRNMFSPVET
jgi:hypothetical protein